MPGEDTLVVVRNGVFRPGERRAVKGGAPGAILEDSDVAVFQGAIDCADLGSLVVLAVWYYVDPGAEDVRPKTMARSGVGVIASRWISGCEIDISIWIAR